MKSADSASPGFVHRYIILLAGEAFSKLCVLAALGYLARALSPTDYGVVETAFAVNVFFVLGVEGGMSAYGARMVAADPSSINALLPRIMLLRVLASLPVIAGVLVFVGWSGSPLSRILAISSWAVLLTPFFTQWVFQGLRQMHWVAAGSAIRNLVLASTIWFMVRPGADLRLVGVADLSGVVALALFNAAVTFGILRARLEVDRLWLRTRELFRDVWPLGLSDFTWACLWYSPVLLSAWMGTSADAAFIGGPIRVVLALHTFIWLYFVNLLPGLARGLADGTGTWQALTDASMRVSMWIGGVVGLFGTLAGGWIVTLLYGPGFVPAIAPFQVVIWVIPVVWFSGNFRFTLIAGGHQRWELRALIIGAVITTVGTLALAPALGALGAAVAFLVGSIGNAWFAVRATTAQVGSVRLMRGMLPCAAAVAFCLALGLALTHVIGMLPATAVAMATYLAVAVWQNAANVHVVLGRLNH